MKKLVSATATVLIIAFSHLVFLSASANNPPVTNQNGNPSSEENVLINVETWVYLEGSLICTSGSPSYSLPMRTNLNSLKILPGQAYCNLMGDTVYSLPGQPYNIIPWYYNGNEGDGYDSYGNPTPGTANYPPNVVDWVLVSLRATPDGTPVCRKAGLLYQDGHVEFVDGGFNCAYPEDELYLVIEHRNHLIIMTPQPVPIIDGIITYDFRNAQSYIDDPFGFGGDGQKELLPDLPGVYAMFAGNGCQGLCAYSDSDVNYDDRSCWENLNTSAGSYVIGDYNMNADCNFNDRIGWEYNNCEFTTVP